MNHRELVLSARKKAKFHFLGLPEELQDEIIDGLDGQTLTLEGARDLARSKGHPLSHEAIGGYYRAVRNERRLFEANQELTRIISEFSDKSYDENLQSLANLIIAMAATGLADGTVGIRDIDLGKVLQAMKGTNTSGQTRPVGGRGSAGDGPGPSPASCDDGKRVIDADKIKELRIQLGL